MITLSIIDNEFLLFVNHFAYAWLFYKNLISLNSLAFCVIPLFKTQITVVCIFLSCLTYRK